MRSVSHHHSATLRNVLQVALNIEQMWFREINELHVFDFEQCDDFSVNITFPSVDQNLLKQTIFSFLHFGLAILKLLGHLRNVTCVFVTCCFFNHSCKFYIGQPEQVVFFIFNEECFASPLRPFADCYK